MAPFAGPFLLGPPARHGRTRRVTRRLCTAFGVSAKMAETRAFRARSRAMHTRTTLPPLLLPVARAMASPWRSPQAALLTTRPSHHIPAQTARMWWENCTDVVRCEPPRSCVNHPGLSRQVYRDRPVRFEASTLEWCDPQSVTEWAGSNGSRPAATSSTTDSGWWWACSERVARQRARPSIARQRCPSRSITARRVRRHLGSR